MTDTSSAKAREVASHENIFSTQSTLATPKNKAPAELKIDFSPLRKTVASIDHPETKKIANATLDACEKRIMVFNENAQNPLMTKELAEELTELTNMIGNADLEISRAGGDSNSIRRAKASLEVVKAAYAAVKAQLMPSPLPMVKTETDWQAHRLRMEQQLLLNAPLQQPFNTALEKIAAKARFDHKIRKDIFICYAKPDDKQPQLQWVVPFLEHLRSHLHMTGFSKTKLDTKDNAVGETKHTYLKGIETDDFVLLIGTPTLRHQYEAEEPTLLTALEHIERKIKNDKALGQKSVFPLLIHGTMESSFPARYAPYKPLDLSDTSQKSYFQQLRELIAHLYGMTEDLAFADIWEEFLAYAEMNQKGARLVLTHRLSREGVVEQLTIEQTQRAEENKKRVEAERRMFAEGNTERKEVKRPSSALGLKQTSADILTDSWHLPQPNDRYFTGRVAELKHLSETFKTTKETQAVILSAVSGLGGVGKTQLAIYHIHHPSQPYALRIWFQAETDSLLHKEYVDFAQQYKLPLEEKASKAEVIKAVKRHLSQQPKWFAVYDNAGSYETIQEFLPTDVHNGHLLITTRRTEWHGNSDSKLEIDMFSETDAITYLKKLIQRDNLSETEENALKTLAQELGYLPLTLAQAGAYIKKHGKSIIEYLTLYRTHTAKMLADKTLPVDSKNQQPVAVTWNISLKAIEADEAKQIRESGEPPLSLLVLQAMSYLYPDHIPRDLLERWLRTLPPTKNQSAIDLLLDQAIGHLVDYSMIQMNVEQRTVSIHRLVQEVVRFQLLQAKSAINPTKSKGDAKLTASAEQSLHSFLLATLIDSSLEEFTLETHVLVDEKRQKALLPHLQALVKYYDSSSSASTLLSSVALGMLLSAIGNVFNVQLGDAAQAKLYYERALKILEQHYGKNHWQVASTLNNLATVYGYLGNAQKKKTLLERVVKIEEQRYGKDCWQMAYTLANLATVYGELGDAQMKKMLLERVLTMQEQHYGKDHWEVAKMLGNLANAHGTLGDGQMKMTLLDRALKIQEQHYGKDHWEVAITLDNLANAYGCLGDVQTKKTLLARTLKIKEQHYGERHWQVAITLNNLVDVHHQLGDISTALERAQQAYRIFTASFKNAEHPHTKTAKENLRILQLLKSQQDSRGKSLPFETKGPSKEHKATTASPFDAKTDTIVMALEERSLDYVQRLQQVVGTTPTGTPIVQHGKKSPGSRWVSFSTFWLKQLPPKAIEELSEELHVSKEQFQCKGS